MNAIYSKCIRPWVLAALMAIALIGCGDSQRNNQGVSVTAFGWYVDSDGGVGLTGIQLPISMDYENGWAGTAYAYFGVQNNLAGEFIRLERVFNEYYIPGATVQPPATSVAVNGVLGAADGNLAAEFGDVSSTLPSTLTNSGGMESVGYFGASYITPAISEFINLNREYMPELPFVMIVTSYAEGVTSAGKRVVTNSISLDVTFTPDVVIQGATVGDVAADGYGNLE